MAKMGRPKKDDAKKKVLSIRLAPDTYQRLLAYASKSKLTMTEVAVKSLEEYLAKRQ